MRIIVQILEDKDGYINALCNDGTVYFWSQSGDGCWVRRFPNVPQN